jgi:putative tryptophan/tyrosine transport system substrate-binding protein
MRSLFFGIALIAMLVALELSAHAQPKKIPLVGILVAGSASSDAARIEAFREGLREIGYVDGKDIVLEYRYADGKLDRLADLAAALTQLKVEVMVTAGPAATRAARAATQTIPIVMAQVNDPVGAGFVASLARPGGNITGLSVMAPELSGKQLELLKETIPKLSRVAAFGTSSTPGTTEALKETELAASALHLQLQFIDVVAPKEIDLAFRTASKGHADALLMVNSPVLFVQQGHLADLAAKNRLPAMYFDREFVEHGGLMSYASNVADLWRRAATHVDKILKGTKPADIPVEQPTKFEFVVNLKAAKQIGLTIPPNVLARADRVIK